MHLLFSDYIQRVNGHRNLCKVIDFMYHSSGAGTSSAKSKVYVISESYNLSLQDLYCTSQAEKTQLSQEFLIETSFQVLKAIHHLNSSTFIRSQGCGYKNGFHGMLRMNHILFDCNGLVKIQDTSNIFFDEYPIKQSDLIFLAPEALKAGAQTQANNRRPQGQHNIPKLEMNNTMDVWTLGMIMLHCMCLGYEEDQACPSTFDSLLNIFQQAKGPSLINLETKEKQEFEDNESRKNSNFSGDSDDQFKRREKSPSKSKDGGDWMNKFFENDKTNDSRLIKFLGLKLFESQNYSKKFIDFLRECLMFDPADRLKAFDLLHHPVFRKYNKIYISQQILMTKPVTEVEKHHLNKLRQ